MLPRDEVNTIRFAVGSPEDVQSWIWRMWVHRDEVYLGARNALTVFKVSLHKSGIWRVAFVNDLERGDMQSDRVIVKWQRPGEFAPGWIPSIGILVSSIRVERPFKKARIKDPGILWFSPPTEENKLIFKVLFSKKGFSENDLKRVSLPSDRLVGQLVKEDGEIVWLIVREEALTFLERSKIVDVMEKTKIHLKPGSSEDSVNDSRALLVVSEDIPTITNQPTVLDIPLGKGNLDIATGKSQSTRGGKQ